MKLVIAEKPSVAMSLAAVLGANEKKDGYLEGNGYLVSWCVGHLLELAQPEAYKEQYAKWRYADLPILPTAWKYEVPKDKKKQLDLLCRLMKDSRVDSVVCATDAGREGELIFRLVYQYAKCKKPMERLWISSMEDAAIRDGFEHLRPGSSYDNLFDAALCRAGADWLVGINATRLFSVLYGVTLNVGRVMSPTLALLVQREAQIRNLGNTYDNQMPSKLFGYFATGKPVLHLAVSENDPTLPYLVRYPLALVLHRKDGITPGTVAKLHSWLHNVQGHALPFAQTARLYPEFTPEKVAEEFLKWL